MKSVSQFQVVKFTYVVGFFVLCASLKLETYDTVPADLACTWWQFSISKQSKNIKILIVLKNKI
jgi:hypothetical protein